MKRIRQRGHVIAADTLVEFCDLARVLGAECGVAARRIPIAISVSEDGVQASPKSSENTFIEILKFKLPD